MAEAHQRSGANGGLARQVAELLSAGAGVVLFIYLIGGIIEQARLEALQLPTDTVMQLLPREAFIVIGVSALRWAIAMALALAVALWWLGDRVHCGWRCDRDQLRRFSPRRLTRGQWTVFGVLVLGAIPSLVTWGHTSASHVRLVLVPLGIAVGTSWVIMWRRPTPVWTAWMVIVVAALFGAVLAYAGDRQPPVALDYAVLQLRDGARTTGYLVGTSSSAVLIAPDVERYTIHRVSAIPRSEVVDLRIRRPSWGAQPESRLQEKVKDKTQRVFLTDIRGSTVWKYPPTMLQRSIDRWTKASTEFSGLVRAPIPASQAVTRLDGLGAEPFVFEGVTVTVRRARVVAVATGSLTQTVILDQPGNRSVRAVCQRPPTPKNAGELAEEFTPGTVLDLRAYVIASGVVVDGTGHEYRRLVLACGEGEPVKPSSAS